MGNYFSTNIPSVSNNFNTIQHELMSQIDLQEKIIQQQQYVLDTLTINNNANNINKYELAILDAKKNKDYEFLVFSGGSIKGLSYCGALDVLNKYNILQNIKNYCGTSVGSIAASLLAIGMTIEDIKILISTMDFDKFIDDKVGVIRDTINVITNYGVCPGKYVSKLVGDQVNKLFGTKNLTIQELYDKTGVTLVIVTTDMNNEKSIYLCPNSQNKLYSDIPIKKAVRMSIGIPFLFEPVVFNNNYHVDGAVLDNYAIHVFDGEYPGDPNARLNLVKPNPKVLGLNITTNKNVVYKTSDLNNRQKIDSLLKYAISFIDTFLTENSRRVLTPYNYLRTINIVTDDYPLTDFNLTDKQKQDLIDAGVLYTEKFFE
jgi:NTE family protein